MNLHRLFRFSALLVLSLMALPAYALRCGGGNVSVGDRSFTVEHKCGKPDYVDRYPQAFLPGVGYVGDVEEWYYNPGPQQLIDILLFIDGRLVRVDTDGHGFTSFVHGHCSPYELKPGMSKYELLMRCGPPDARQSFFQGRIGTPERLPIVITQYVDEWTYNFGSSHFVRHIRLVDGRIESVQLGERGY